MLKGNEQPVKATNYFNCSYWVNAAIAEHLTKGTLVELYGRISVNTWTNNEGEAKAIKYITTGTFIAQAQEKVDIDPAIISVNKKLDKVSFKGMVDARGMK